MKTIKT